jgi:hypothetical protein
MSLYFNRRKAFRDEATTTTDSFLFNGSSEYITVLDNANYEFSTGWTVNAWVNLDSGFSSEGSVFGKFPTSPNRSWYLRVSADKKLRWTQSAGGTSVDTLNGTSALSVSTWTMVSCTSDGTTVRLYQNGVADGTLSSSNIPKDSTGGLFIGRIEDGGSPFYFDGSMCAWQILPDYEMSAAQLVTAYNSGQPITYSAQDSTVKTNTALYIEGTARDSTLNDLKNSNDGTAQGSITSDGASITFDNVG